ncbi:MAG: VacJ family lipoprotein [Gammaproteobacteria bacterium]
MKFGLLKKLIVLTLLSTTLLLSGCQTGATRAETDPLEGINRPIYGFNDGLDRGVMKPVAKGYVAVTSKPVRSSVTNFFDNLASINVIFNDVLQGKFKQAVGDTARFVINTTVGILGFFDPATSAGLVKHDEDLGQTFGTWGAGEGAYLSLPLFGPSSLRDAPDLVTSTLLNPLFYISSGTSIPLFVLMLVDQRANLLDASTFRDEAALDPYAFTREAYRQHRTSLIYDGNPPVEELDDFFSDDDFSDETEGVLIIE